MMSLWRASVFFSFLFLIIVELLSPELVYYLVGMSILSIMNAQCTHIKIIIQ